MSQTQTQTHNVAAVYRRVNLVDFHGDTIRTFRDETGLCIWVSLKDLINNIGISLGAEHDRLTLDTGLIRHLHVSSIKAYMPDGTGVEELFIPHQKVNAYLFSVPVDNIPSSVTSGNLEAYQEDFLVVLNQHWMKIEGSAVSYSPLELRRAVIECSTSELRRSLITLSSSPDLNLEGEEADEYVDKVTLHAIMVIKQELGCHMKTYGSMTAVELDAINTAISSLRNYLELLILIGANSTTAVGNSLHGLKPWLLEMKKILKTSNN